MASKQCETELLNEEAKRRHRNFYQTYRAFEQYMVQSFDLRSDENGDWFYLKECNDFKIFLFYLSLLQCTIHPNLIRNYDLFDRVCDPRKDFLEIQASIPGMFECFVFGFRGPGWYREDSVFTPFGDEIGVAYGGWNKENGPERNRKL